MKKGLQRGCFLLCRLPTASFFSLFVLGFKTVRGRCITLSEFLGEAVAVSGRQFFYKRFIWQTKSWIR